MANDIYTIKKSTLDGITNAIREKDGTTEPIFVENIATKIRAIPSSGGLPEGISISEIVVDTEISKQGKFKDFIDANKNPNDIFLFAFLKDYYNLPQYPEFTVADYVDRFQRNHNVPTVGRFSQGEMVFSNILVPEYAGKASIGDVYILVEVIPV